ALARGHRSSPYDPSAAAGAAADTPRSRSEREAGSSTDGAAGPAVRDRCHTGLAADRPDRRPARLTDRPCPDGTRLRRPRPWAIDADAVRDDVGHGHRHLHHATGP